MSIKATFVHVNVIAKNWKKLSEFYISAFGCKPVLPERHLRGQWLDDSTALSSIKIDGIHLSLPGVNGIPITLEIFQYNENDQESSKVVNRPGFAHIAFRVADVHQALRKVVECGGGSIGKLITQKIDGVGTLTFVYAYDSEGNIIELQSWE